MDREEQNTVNLNQCVMMSRGGSAGSFSPGGQMEGEMDRVK